MSLFCTGLLFKCFRITAHCGQTRNKKLSYVRPLLLSIRAKWLLRRSAHKSRRCIGDVPTRSVQPQTSRYLFGSYPVRLPAGSSTNLTEVSQYSPISLQTYISIVVCFKSVTTTSLQILPSLLIVAIWPQILTVVKQTTRGIRNNKNISFLRFFLRFVERAFRYIRVTRNQLDALFILSLFRQSTSTCFGHICSPSSGGILYIYNTW